MTCLNNKISFLLEWFSFPYLLAFMWLENTEHIASTMILMAITFLFTNKLIYKTANKINMDLSILKILFALKIIVAIFILYNGWIPRLNINDIFYGYDPQRYYYQSYELFQSGFDLIKNGILNFTGILYYFAVIFAVFGHNPVIPLLINSVTTLITCIFLIKLTKINLPDMKNAKEVFFFIMIPEIIWYDMLVSRESICMALVLVCIYMLIEMFFVDDKIQFKKGILFCMIFVLLGTIRMSLIIPIILLFAIYWMSIKNIKKRMLLIILLILLVLVLPTINSNIGSSKFSFSNILDDSLAHSEGLNDLNWSSNSIGKLLIGENIIQRIIFVPARIFVYLVAPLPLINFDINGLMAGDWMAWQEMLTVMSSIIYFFSLPRVFAAIISYIKNKNKMNFIAIILPFLMLMVAVSYGNDIIHERYRIIALPFLYAMILLGKNGDSLSNKWGWIIWLLMLIVCFVFYVCFKM